MLASMLLNQVISTHNTSLRTRRCTPVKMPTTDLEAIFGVVGVICAISIMRGMKRNKRWKNRRWWTRPWIQRRDTKAGNIHRLVNEELRLEDPQCFKNYLRMDEQSFCKLKGLVESRIKKKNTHLRECISVEKR